MEKQFPTIDKVKTGKQIRRLMNSLGLTVTDVQKYMGLATQQAVYHWLNGRSLPSIDNVYALSELFKVPMDQIICGNSIRNTEGTYRKFNGNILLKFLINAILFLKEVIV